MPTARQARRWGRVGKVAEILKRPPQTVRRLAERGYIAVNRLPGCWPLYSLDDAERLAKDAIHNSAP